MSLLSACADIATTNPFDPDMPRSQQATAAIIGHVVLSDGYVVDLFFGNMPVSLPSVSDSGFETRKAVVDTEGRFQFLMVPPDTYQLSLTSEAFSPGV